MSGQPNRSSARDRERRAKLAAVRQGPADFSDFRELGFSSPGHLREVVEAIECYWRGEAQTFPMEDVFAELELEDSLRSSSSHPTEEVGSSSSSSG